MLKSFLDFITEGVYDPSIFKAIFLASGPGGGKSYVVGKTTKGLGFKVVNSDDLFEYLLRQNKIPMDMTRMDKEMYHQSQIQRDIAKQTTKVKEKIYKEARLGLIIDGTGKDYDKIKGQKEKLEELGYDCLMIFVNTSLETTLKRNQKRERRVREDIVKDNWYSVQGNIGKFQNLFGQEKFIVVDNDDGASEESFNKIWKQIKKFSESPLQNPIAKYWVKSELENKKK